MSEERIVPDAQEFASHASRATVLVTNILQSLLVAVVVLWVLDLPRQLFGFAFYTEQMLTVCLGLTLGLAYLADTSRPRHWFDWACVIVSLLLCAYIAARYEQLTYELAFLPLEGIIGSIILIALIMEASRRTNGWGFVTIIAAMAVYVYISPHLPGDFQTRYVSPERMIVYLGLDVNGAIGNILQVAVLIVIPFTILGQVLARTGGADFFADISMAAMGHFRGGAAKIAVVGSALFGMISGSAVIERARGRHRDHPDHGQVRLHQDALGCDRGGRIHRRAVDAAGDGRLSLHHGGIPAGALWASLHRRGYSCLPLLRLPVFPRRPRSRQAKDRRRQDRGSPARQRGHQVRLALPGADRLPRLRTDVSGRHAADAREGGDLLDRDPDRAGADLRLSRQAAEHPRYPCRASWRPAGSRSTSS